MRPAGAAPGGPRRRPRSRRRRQPRTPGNVIWPGHRSRGHPARWRGRVARRGVDMAAGSAPATVADGAPAVQVRTRSMAGGVLALGYLLAAILVTWRLWADPASRIVAGNPDDADLFAWYMRYAATAVAHGSLPALVTQALNAPQGINAMWNPSMLLPCVALAPVTLLFGPQVSLTLLTTIGFAGSAFAMYWVLRRWQVSAFAAGLAGAVYGFSPALLHAATGHYE